MSNIKLSICIPTFNREMFLRETLDSVLEQLTDDIINDVEIVVSDNASSDNTDTLISEYRMKHKNIVYYRWPQNMGADRNYLKVIDLSNGEYCWFLGSDDKANNGSVKRVLAEIEDEQFDILLFGRDESDVFLSAPPTTNYWNNLRQDYSFHSKNDKDKFYHYLDNCNSIGGLFSYLSAIVFNKGRWDNVSDKTRFVGSAYVHVHVLLTVLNEGALFKYVHHPLVLCRMGNDSFCTDSENILNVYRRWKLDIDGYRDIPMYVFGSDSYEYYYIHRVMTKYVSTETFITLNILMKRALRGQYRNQVELLLRNSGFFKKYYMLKLMQNAIFDKARKLYRKFVNCMK